jgi:hypothetical protein
VDWGTSSDDIVSVQGSGYSGSSTLNGRDVSLVAPFLRLAPHVNEVDGGNVQAQWVRRLAGGADTQLRADLERTSRV